MTFKSVSKVKFRKITKVRAMPVCREIQRRVVARESNGLAPFQRQKGCSRDEAMVFQKEEFHP